MLLVRFNILPDKLREFEQTGDWLYKSGVSLQEGEHGRLYRRWGSEKAEFLYVEALPDGDDVRSRINSGQFRTFMGAIKVLGEVTEADVITAGEVRPMGNEEYGGGE